jgi:NADH-quinone oxidoreductase subunit N
MNTLIVVSVLGIISMLSDILGFKKLIFPIVLVGLLIALGLNIAEWDQSQVYFNMLLIDNYAIAFGSIILGLLFFWMLLSVDQYKYEFNKSDQYALILFSTVGAYVMVSFSNIIMLFVGIEVMSIPLYILAGSRKSDLSSNEASLKYFIMGAFTTGILLFGIALVYGATGSFDIAEIKNFITSNSGEVPTLLYTGIVFLIIALSFKISAVPFHFWAPDVYQGSPMMITTYMASVVKVAGFGAFYRLFSYTFSDLSTNWSIIITVIVVLTILVGNIMAVGQTNIKRMLAYSGISQAGYMLMTLLILNQNSTNALLFYAGSYAFATMAAFTVLYLLSKESDLMTVDAFKGLGKKNPILAFVMTVAMLSLAGIPPTVGFFAKFYLFTTLIAQGYTALVIVAVLGSLISVYYYFKVIIAMYGKETEENTIKLQLNIMYQVVLMIMVGLIILFGVYPSAIIELIK